MGQCGNLDFYTEQELADPQLAVFEVLKYSRAECVASATRTLEPDRGWEALQEEFEKPFVAVKVAEDDVPTEYFLHRHFRLEEAAALYRPDVCTRLFLGRNKVGMEVFEGIRQSIQRRSVIRFLDSLLQARLSPLAGTTSGRMPNTIKDFCSVARSFLSACSATERPVIGRPIAALCLIRLR